MVKYLKNKEIERVRWDRCIESAAFESIYPYSWYLDLVSPGWEALVMGDYEMIMPLTRADRMGLKLLLQPILAQQLGILSSRIPETGELAAFLDAVKRNFHYADICLNRTNQPLPGSYKPEMRINHELDLSGEPAYNSNTRRNLARGRQSGPEFRKIGLEDYMDLKFSLEKRVAVKRSYLQKLLGGLLERGSAEIFGLYAGKVLQAGAVLARSKTRALYLNGCSSPEGKESRAMFVLMDRLIGSCRGRVPVFDFEGSNFEGVGRFFEGFGAVKTLYPRLRIRKFPFSLR